MLMIEFGSSLAQQLRAGQSVPSWLRSVRKGMNEYNRSCMTAARSIEYSTAVLRILSRTTFYIIFSLFQHPLYFFQALSLGLWHLKVDERQGNHSSNDGVHNKHPLNCESTHQAGEGGSDQ